MKTSIIGIIIVCCLFSIFIPYSSYAQVTEMEITNEVDIALSDWIDGFNTNYREQTAVTKFVMSLEGGAYKATGTLTFYKMNYAPYAHKEDHIGEFVVFFNVVRGEINVEKLCVYKVYGQKKCRS